MSRTSETRHIKWHETFKCKCRLDASVCNNKQYWNKDKCKFECNELIDKGIWDEEFLWNHSICDCECNKSFDVGEYLDYENSHCKRKLVGQLVEECSENVDGNEMIYDGTLNDYRRVCNSCTKYIVLFIIAYLTIIGISSACFLFYWFLKKINFETTIY